MGSGPAKVVPVRIDPELRAAVAARAETDGTTTSEIIREALRRFLDVNQAEQAQHASGPPQARRGRNRDRGVHQPVLAVRRGLVLGGLLLNVASLRLSGGSNRSALAVAALHRGFA